MVEIWASAAKPLGGTVIIWDLFQVALYAANKQNHMFLFK